MLIEVSLEQVCCNKTYSGKWVLHTTIDYNRLIWKEWTFPSGKFYVLDRCSKLTSAPVTYVVVGSIPGQTHSSCDREGDSLWQRRFPPGAPVSSYIHCKSPNIVYGANNVLVDAQLSIQYFYFMF
jgi:hypothetical protein